MKKYGIFLVCAALITVSVQYTFVEANKAGPPGKAVIEKQVLTADVEALSIVTADAVVDLPAISYVAAATQVLNAEKVTPVILRRYGDNQRTRETLGISPTTSKRTKLPGYKPPLRL